MAATLFSVAVHRPFARVAADAIMRMSVQPNVGLMNRPAILNAVMLVLAAWPCHAQSPQSTLSARGELLYTTHCIACHSAEVHWRDRRLAGDWESLTAQVARWQSNAGLGWSRDEILDVVRYLNATYYRFPDEAPLQQG
jgi:mono/diheme cytochrome c family protein